MAHPVALKLGREALWYLQLRTVRRIPGLEREMAVSKVLLQYGTGNY